MPSHLKQPVPAQRNGRARGVSSAALLELVSDLSSRFANVEPHEVDEEVHRALERVLDLFDFDRCSLFKLSDGSDVVSVVGGVNRHASGALPPTLDAGAQFPWALDRLRRQNTAVAIASLDALPVAAPIDRESFRRWGTRSLLLLPIARANKVDYVVSFASTRRPFVWEGSQIARLRLLGESIVGAMRRKAHDEMRAEADRFERLIADVSFEFAAAPWDRIDDQIDRALNALLTFTRADQCAFFTLLAEKGEACLTHLATHEVTVPVGSKLNFASGVPWLYEKVVTRGEAIAFRRRNDLPREAAVDIAYLESKRTHAAVYIPFAVDGVTRYILAVVVNGSEREWSEQFVERLKVLGTLFITTLNRQAIVGARVKAQQRLRVAESFAQATLDALNEYVAVVDGIGTLVETSHRWRDLANGDEAPEAVPKGDNYLLACEATTGPNEDAAMELAQAMRRVLDGETDRLTLESARVSHGGLRWIRSRIHRFVVDGNVYAAVGHEDITSQRRSELELQDLRAQHWHSERITQTGVLIASLAHELSQPLTAILSNAQAGMRFIASDSLDPQEIREILSDIVADDKRAAEIIDSLRLMLRRQKTEREPIDVAVVVQEVVKLLHSEFIRQQVRDSQDCAPGCIVMANKAQLQQVVLNLMMNGVEAMASVAVGERRLHITVGQRDGAKVRISVKDSGIGVAPGGLEKVFDAFWTTKSTGTGMGLTICHSIVESHGGHIWGAPNDGGGSTFFVDLPAAAPAHRDIPGRSHVPASNAAAPLGEPNG